MQQCEPTYPGIVGSGTCVNCSRLQADIEKLTDDLKLEKGFTKQFAKQRDDAHRQIDQLQQQLTEAVAEKNRLQCNVDYMGSIGGRG